MSIPFYYKMGTIGFDIALGKAAFEGHIAEMTMLKERGATDWNGALTCAAQGGHMEAMNLLVKWGATEWDRALAKGVILQR